MPLPLRGGCASSPALLLTLRAHVVVPDVSASTTALEFGTVWNSHCKVRTARAARKGIRLATAPCLAVFHQPRNAHPPHIQKAAPNKRAPTQVFTVQLHNPHQVAAEWSIKKPAVESPKLRDWDFFAPSPAEGVLEPGARANLVVTFTPQVGGLF